MNDDLLLEIILEALLDEAKKKKRPGKKEYYKGTKKSNKEMEYEIGICSGENPPARCYKEWTADKSYKKSRKGKKK